MGASFVSGGSQLFAHPFSDEIGLVHTLGLCNAFQCRHLLGKKPNPHYGLGSLVENGLLNLFHLIFELCQIMGVPESPQLFDRIGLYDLAHVQRLLGASFRAGIGFVSPCFQIFPLTYG